MDIAQLAMTATTLLMSMIVEEGGKAALQRLWQTICDRFAPKDESRITETFQRLKEHPGDVRLQAELEARLVAKLTVDPGFRRELARLVEEAGGYVAPSGPPTPPPTALHQLPADIADFAGRENEVTALREGAKQAKTAPAILVVTGIGGSGKSALAIHVAHLLQEQFSDIQLYIDLQGAGSSPLAPENALASFLRALGVDGRSILRMNQDERARSYRSQLSGKRALVLLDNARDAAQVRPLLPGNSDCAVLVTSRRSLNALAGKTVDVRLRMLKEKDALALLEQLIGKDRVATDLEDAKRIVHLCGCLPLAVRVAGGQLKIKGDRLGEFASRLEDEQGRLKRLKQSDLDVWASFMVSYQDLNRPEARLFRLLGLLPGESFTSEAAVVLGAAEESAPRDFLDRLAVAKKTEKDAVPELLDRLVDMRLLEPIGGGRYSFHDLMRLFARECLADEKPRKQRAARLRIAHWYAGQSGEMNEWLVPEKCAKKVAELAGKTRQPPEEVSRSEMLKALTWFEMERPNLVAAVEWAYEGKDWETTWRLAENLSNFYNIRCHWVDWERTHVLALDATRKGHDTRHEGTILTLLGNVYRLQGRWDKSVELFQKALGLHRKLKDPTGESIALNLLANDYRLQGHWDEAITAFEESLEINRRSGNRYGEGIALGGLGNVYRMQGRWEDALKLYEESLKISLERKDPRGRCITLNNIGLVYSRQSRLSEADAVLAESLSICDDMNFPRGKCIAHITLGEVRMLQGRWDEALEHLTCGLEMARKLDDRRCICQSLNSLGKWYTRQGRWEKADQCFEEARAILCGMGDRHGEGLALRNKGLLLAAQNRVEEAASLWREALGKLHSSSPEHKEVTERLQKG